MAGCRATDLSSIWPETRLQNKEARYVCKWIQKPPNDLQGRQQTFGAWPNKSNTSGKLEAHDMERGQRMRGRGDVSSPLLLSCANFLETKKLEASEYITKLVGGQGSLCFEKARLLENLLYLCKVEAYLL